MRIIGMNRKTIFITAGVALLIAVAAGWFFLHKSNGPFFKTAKAARGDLQAAVTATGTVNAVTTVLVGTQVSGTIKELYVDYNSPVKKDGPRPDRSGLLAGPGGPGAGEPAAGRGKRGKGRGGRPGRQADFRAQQDTVHGELHRPERPRHGGDERVVHRRLSQRGPGPGAAEPGGPDPGGYEPPQHQDPLPVDGTVISRSIDVGQTVAASFQTPTLFNIAQDLTRMQIDTNVDEADIGKVKVGQPVTFTVDAYPEAPFQGDVSVVRNAPTTVQNVVTYDVVVKVANPDLKLKPGMTANVSIIIDRRTAALKVPTRRSAFGRPIGKAGGRRPPLPGPRMEKTAGSWPGAGGLDPGGKDAETDRRHRRDQRRPVHGGRFGRPEGRAGRDRRGRGRGKQQAATADEPRFFR